MRAIDYRGPDRARLQDQRRIGRNRTGFAIGTAALLAASIGMVALIRSRRGSGEPSSGDLQGFGGTAGDSGMLHDPKAFRAYDAAIGDLGDAGGAPSLGGPAA